MSNVTKVQDLLNQIGYAIDHCEDMPAFAIMDAMMIHNAKSKEIIALVEKMEKKLAENVSSLNEARLPHKFVNKWDGITRNGCPNCYDTKKRDVILYAEQKFCSVCGQAIKYVKNLNELL